MESTPCDPGGHRVTAEHYSMEMNDSTTSFLTIHSFLPYNYSLCSGLSLLRLQLLLTAMSLPVPLSGAALAAISLEADEQSFNLPLSRPRRRNKRKAVLQPSASSPPPPSAVGADSSAPTPSPRIQRPPRQQKQCMLCGLVFPRQEVLRTHLVAYHGLRLVADRKTRWDPVHQEYTQMPVGRVQPATEVMPAVGISRAAPPFYAPCSPQFRPQSPLPPGTLVDGAGSTALPYPMALESGISSPPPYMTHESLPALPSSQPLHWFGSASGRAAADDEQLAYPGLAASPTSVLFAADDEEAQSTSQAVRARAHESSSMTDSSPLDHPHPAATPVEGNATARSGIEAPEGSPINTTSSVGYTFSASGMVTAKKGDVFGADCARCVYRGYRGRSPPYIMHCKDCAVSNNSSNFHLCSTCFLAMRNRYVQSADQPFTLQVMCPLLRRIDGSDESVADHVSKHEFTSVYNFYTTLYRDFDPNSLDAPLRLQSNPPRGYNTSDLCTDLVARVFKTGCIINDLSGCLDHRRWKLLQRSLQPNSFDMSVFYHQASEHEFLSLLFWVRSNILHDQGRLGLNFLDASGLPHLQRLRASSDMAFPLFERWQSTIRIRHPERAQMNIHTLNFSLLKHLILAFTHPKLVEYFMRDCFKEAFEGFTCGHRPQRLFRKLNERIRIVIDDQPEPLHELLFFVLSPVVERIERGASSSPTTFARVLGGYLSDVLYVGEELRAFWYWRTCRHTMSTLSYRILEELRATDTTLDPSATGVTQLSLDENELVFLIGDIFDVLCPREPLSSEDSVALQRVVQLGNGHGSHLWRLLDCLVRISDESFERSSPHSTTAVSLLFQLVNVLIYTWRGFDEKALKIALLECCSRRDFLALSGILTAHVSWNHNKLHMMELMKVLPRRLERQSSLSLQSRLMPRTINRLLNAAHPSVSRNISSVTIQIQEENELNEEGESEDEKEEPPPTLKKQLELCVWREEARWARDMRNLSDRVEVSLIL